MAINDFKNIENINLNLDSTAQLVESKDLNIFKTSAKNITDFGMSKNDVIEFRLYDLSNNLLEQSNGKNVRYIHKEHLPKYLKNQVDSNTQELIYDIDIEKLVKEAGYGNGEFKVVFNFLKNYLGNENTKQRVWIHEISPSRTEIRILPLITTDENQNIKLKNRYEAFSQNTSELRENKNIIAKLIDSVELFISDYIDNWFIQIHGQKWLDVVKTDFKFLNDTQYKQFKQKIFSDFRKSINYQLDGKEFRLGNPNYGQAASFPIDLDEFVVHGEIMLMIDSRLSESINYNMENVAFRDFPVQIKEELKSTKESKELQSLLDINYISTSNIKQNNNVGNLQQDAVIIDTTPKQNPPIIIKIDAPPPAPPVLVEPTPTPTPIITGGGGGGGGRGGDVYQRNMEFGNYIDFNYNFINYT